ncbi:MAG: MarR family transcriptional regulator [Myxococcales bacterium]|nr:MarR family transcriptional regulator [Myxococcales bacterium]MCB9645043.1 MarR family transcriptional regulator [Deltaproteobacteria bacterium]
MQDLRRLADRPTWLLGRAYARSRTLLNEGFGQEGLSGYHFRVLAALDEHGSLSQADLGRHAKLDRSDVVATVNDLVEARLVRRDADAADRRRNIIAITASGASALERLGQRLDEVQDRLLEALSPRERVTLVRLLRKLT